MTKPAKTKDELRKLILSEIAGQPVCPAGMDVSIRAAEAGSWEVDSIPPGSIAHADCVHYIGQIARRLRAEYDLAPDPMYNQIDWMNPSSSDVADQVIRQNANRRRRFIEATSDFVPDENLAKQDAPARPLQQTLTPDGRVVDFSIANQREDWLKTQPNDVAIVFAARAALRALPTATFASGAGRSRMTRRKMVLRVFRALAAAWSYSAYPSSRDVLREAARSALKGLGSMNATLTERAAVYASAAAASAPDDVASRASIAVGYALDAIGAKGRQAFELTLEALAADADLLDQKFSPVSLANSQLWPTKIPDWVNEDWAHLKQALLDAKEDWEVWTGWYDDRLVGAPANEDHELARVTITEQFWDEDPEAVNSQIKWITEEIKELTPVGETDLPSIEAIPPQSETGSQFVQITDGRIDLALDPPSHSPVADQNQREIYQELRYKASTLSALGHNQLGDLSGPITRFLAALPERIEDVSIIRIWSRGNTLRVRLKAHETASASTDHSDPALLAPLAAELLQDLIHSHNVFIVGDPHGRELDEVRLGPRERHEDEAIVQSASIIADAVRESEGLVTPAAAEALTEQVDAARNAPAGIHGDQALDLSRKTTSNFVVEILRAVYVPYRKLLAEGEFAWKEIRSGAYRAAGPAAILGAYHYRQELITFVVDHAATLKVFVQQVFQNPELIQIIDAISKAAIS